MTRRDEAADLVVIKVPKTTVRVLGQPCTYYPVRGRTEGRYVGSTAVLGTGAEEHAWRTAAERFDAALLEARRAHTRGARWARRRAERRCLEALTAAENDYAPVRDVIERRYAEVEARRRVWGWAVVEAVPPRDEIYVYRHDVPGTEPAPGPSSTHPLRSEEPLSARGLERELYRLGDVHGLTDVRWEDGATERVRDECALPDEPGAFEAWWSEFTERGWRSSREVPLPDAPPPRPSPAPDSGGGTRAGRRHRGPERDYDGVGEGHGGYGGGFFGGY
ncbi:recG-like helicase [Streptomyces laurentii]|uniref:RecG-like helicase n=1 Tax=Streptomyces laurentii TaxID=39478 RepID=A0A160P653_STRLU|nr:recG-like helicase [Streptomyces laurentii]